VVKFHFTNSETKTNTFFYLKVNSKVSNFKILVVSWTVPYWNLGVRGKLLENGSYILHMSYRNYLR